jgi:NO-binding membrane sensor protein with MHYT domain
VHGLYAAIATSSDPGMLLTPSRHGAALDLLALLYATAAAFLALSLLDAHPAKDGRQRWIRRVLAALPLGLAVLLVNWIGFAAVGAAPIAPGPARWPASPRWTSASAATASTSSPRCR